MRIKNFELFEFYVLIVKMNFRKQSERKKDRNEFEMYF